MEGKVSVTNGVVHGIFDDFPRPEAAANPASKTAFLRGFQISFHCHRYKNFI
ncbi:hypothetical protein Q31b_19290 [Novipirellula aureliae]|uniref:Uncharacterized protein n=1 Tax=Novipirellula aureliae TaxID=2527966 RepID=A0A5C6E3Z9_9BACT|nr:hypothetical protein Q31b_19290 [Novipirellula aureliae]